MAQIKKQPIGTDGKPMTIWQIWLRRLCIVVIVWAGLELVLGIFFLLLALPLPLDIFRGIEAFIALSEEASWALLGVSSLVGAFLNVVIAFLGIRGSENPYKIALFFWITLFDAVITAWALVGNISNGLFDLSSTVSGLFFIALAICTWQVRKQTGYFEQKRLSHDE